MKMKETELDKSELNVNENAENGKESKHVVVKVLGLVFGIIAAIVILSVVFSKTLLPIYRYNNAEKNAANGDYATATQRLQGLNYKDSRTKYGEYACKAAESYYDSNDMDNAIEYFNYALSSNIEKYQIEAIVYIYNIQPEEKNYFDGLAELVLDEADSLYEAGDIDKAMVYYNYAKDSQNEDIKAQAESRLSE